MPLSNGQVKVLEDWLKSSSSLRGLRHLCSRPFQDPNKGQFVSLEDASKLRDFWPPSRHAVGSGILLAVLEVLAVALVNGIWYAGFQRSLFPFPAPLVLFLGGTVFLAANLGICMYVLWQPVHAPDALFGRLLQHRLKLAKPLFNSTMVKLIREPRFKEILKRGCDSTLPSKSEKYRENSLILQLVNEVRNDPKFETMFGDFSASQTTEGEKKSEEGKSDSDGDHAFVQYLRYIARRRLFEAIVNDPDLKYIYDGLSQGLDGFLHRISTIDITKLSEIFSKIREDKPAVGADVQGIANLLLLIVLSGLSIHYVSQGVNAAVKLSIDPSGIAEPNSDSIAVALKGLQDSISSALKPPKSSNNASCCSTPSQPQQLNVNLPPQWTVKLDNPPIQVPQPISVPSTISISPPIKFPESTTVTLPLQPAGGQENGNGQQTQGNGNGAQRSSQSGGNGTNQQPQNAGPPNTNLPNGPPNLSGDAVVVLGSNNNAEPFTLWNGAVECVYTLTSSNWTEDPLPLTIKSQQQSGCRAAGADTYFVTNKPVFVAHLGVYLSIEDWHRWLYVGKKESVVVRIHAAQASVQGD
jgi:hypothetical protein